MRELVVVRLVVTWWPITPVHAQIWIAIWRSGFLLRTRTAHGYLSLC